jgi:hypothetical protein
MNQQELYELTTKLYESSESMKEISMDCSDILLQMSIQTLELLQRSNIPEEIQKEVDDIASEILSDD